VDPLPNLLAAITDDPHDFQQQLVLADHLLSLGDPRGELIVLDCHERTTPGGLTAPEAIEQLLLLAAEYTFPRARDVPDLVLPFRGAPEAAAYDLSFEGAHYLIQYRRRILTITVQYGTSPGGVTQFPRKALERVQAASAWTADEARQILRVISDAIIAGAPLRHLQFPLGAEPLPEYPAGAVRCYRLPAQFTGPRRISPTRYGLAARDHERWNSIWNRLRAITLRGA
jgi:uncharacterized protein (TIGR02996 family)